MATQRTHACDIRSCKYRGEIAIWLRPRKPVRRPRGLPDLYDTQGGPDRPSFFPATFSAGYDVEPDEYGATRRQPAAAFSHRQLHKPTQYYYHEHRHTHTFIYKERRPAETEPEYVATNEANRTKRTIQRRRQSPNVFPLEIVSHLQRNTAKMPKYKRF